MMHTTARAPRAVVATLPMLARRRRRGRDAQAARPAPIHERDVAVLMRDGVRLAPTCSGRPQGRVPTLVYRHAVTGRMTRSRSIRPFTRAGRARLRGRRAGRARPLHVGRRIPALRERRPRRIRHDRMGRPAALVERPRRHVRLVVSGRRAVARRRREPAAPRGDGPGDDLLDAAELLLQRRHLGPVLDLVDLGQHRARCPRQKAPAAGREGGPRQIERARAADARARCRSTS